MRISLTAQNSLNSFCHYAPTVIQVTIDSWFVQQQFTQSLQRTLNSNHDMTERHTYITQHCRVCQVALQTGNRKFHSQMFQDRRCYTQVTFRIFKVNRIHFMRHGTRSHFSGFNLLLEILHRDVLPEVTIHIDHNRIDTLHTIKNSRKVIIVRNLCSIFFTLQSQFLCNKPITELFPVILRISYMMCIVISGSTTKLSGNRTCLQHSQLTFETVNEYHHFLA